MKPQILGIVGFRNSGKDTIGNHLRNQYGYQKDSFASPLKSALCSIFGWEPEMVEGVTPESRVWRESVDEYWSKKTGIKDFTPRYAMQYIGTDLLRDHLHKGIWVDSLEKRIQSTDKNIVITDGRFRNELDMIKRSEGVLISVIRNKPEWWDIAVQYNEELYSGKNPTKPIELEGIHETELSWVGYPMDYVIVNDGSLAELYQKVDDLDFLRNRYGGV